MLAGLRQWRKTMGKPMNRATAVILLALTCVFQPAATAQTVAPMRPMVVPKIGGAAQIDYKALYNQEREKNQRLREQLDAWTRRGGSLVHAYCESPTRSANSAGESSDCAAAGFACEPVSGLCRTTAANSDQCAAGFIWCSSNDHCVRSAQECP